MQVLAAAKVPVVVVSSMGAQSTGKSFQLNHLGGCLFDVAGGRCTDGCWMTARPVSLRGRSVMVVFLDCEGLGKTCTLSASKPLCRVYATSIYGDPKFSECLGKIDFGSCEDQFQ